MIDLAKKSLASISPFIGENYGKIFEAVKSYMSSSPYGDYANQWRALELLIVNASDHDLEWNKPYFKHGDFHWHPKPLHIPAGGISFAVVSNDKGGWSPRKRVAGGFRYRIKGTEECFLHLGFANPQKDPYKHYITVKDGAENAQYGCDEARDDYPKAETINGFHVTCTNHEPIKPLSLPLCYNMLFIYTITEKDENVKKANDANKQGIRAAGKEKQHDVPGSITNQSEINVPRGNPDGNETSKMPVDSGGINQAKQEGALPNQSPTQPQGETDEYKKVYVKPASMASRYQNIDKDDTPKTQVEEVADKDKPLEDDLGDTPCQRETHVARGNSDGIEASEMPSRSEGNSQTMQEGTASNPSRMQALGKSQQFNANQNQTEPGPEAEQPISTERNNGDTHNGCSVCCCLKQNTVVPE